MKFCIQCGKEIMDEAVICPSCGCSQENKPNAEHDSGSFGWAILGFFIPLVGLILYLVWNDNKPLNARSIGLGALVGFIVRLVFRVLSAVIAGLFLTIFAL